MSTAPTPIPLSESLAPALLHSPLVSPSEVATVVLHVSYGGGELGSAYVWRLNTVTDASSVHHSLPDGPSPVGG